MTRRKKSFLAKMKKHANIEWTCERTNERTNERKNERTNEQTTNNRTPNEEKKTNDWANKSTLVSVFF